MRVIEESQIQNDFNGFKDEKTIFEMQSGSKWQQAEYKYNYYYAHMPKAKIIEEFGNFYLQVDGISEQVLVKQL